jgi:polar amino acid transport system ATP-binding protein
VVLALAKSGSTMLIVTHEMAFAKAIADRVLFLENGEIVEESHDARAFFTKPETERAQQFLHSFEY